MQSEPDITINGHKLSSAQSMTVRVALESFNVVLVRKGLGDDNHGKEMTKLYSDRIAEIRLVMYPQRID